jgi:chromosome segregation protein
MTIENTRHVLPTEYSEVEITRRLYRSGESDYLLNGRSCRLKDIQDLFMDTGMGAGAYSVIELKMIEDILSENAQDRRRLFEEAAGITKYKLRRTQALRKLDATQADLTRIRDIVDEVGRNVRSLARQAKKAARYRELSEAWRSSSLQVARVEFDRLSGERSALDQERGALDDRVQELTTQQTGEDARLEARRKELLDLERQLADRQKDLNEHLEAIRQLESEVRVQEERANAARTALDRAEREKKDAERRTSQLGADIERLKNEKETLQPRLDAALAVLKEAKETRDRLREETDGRRLAVETLRMEEDALLGRRADRMNEQARLGNRIEMLAEERGRLERQSAEVAAGMKDILKRKEANKSEFDAADSKVGELESTLREAETKLLGLQRQIEDSQNELHSLERQREGMKAEAALLESLLLSQEEAGEAVKYLASDSGWSAGVASTVADVVACDDQYAVAVESALGSYANCLVVQSEKEVDAALGVLDKSEKGAVAFVVLERLGVVTAVDAINDDRAIPITNVIRTTAKKHKGLTDVLFHDAYIVDDLTTARALANTYGGDRPLSRFVARTGEWADGLGRIYGGGSAESTPATSRIGRKERLAVLHEEIKSVAARCVQHGSSLENLRAETALISVGDFRSKVRDAEQIRARFDQERARIESEEGNLARNLEGIQARGDTVAESQSSNAALLESISEELEKLGDGIAEVTGHRVEAQAAFQETENESRLAEASYGNAHVAALEVKHESETIERDSQRMTSDLDDLVSRAERREGEMADLQEQITAATVRQDECRKDIIKGYEDKKALDEAVNGAETEVNDLRSAISDQDVALREVRRLREAAMRDEGSRVTRLAEIKTRLEDLVERIRMDFECELDDVVASSDPDFDVDAARQEGLDLRDKLRNMGAVNELALETYEEEKERLDFLTTQREDLEAAEKTLVDTIEEINATASLRFMDTFEKIQSHFSELFEQLFGEGATAQLSIPEDSDPLEAPIEITARPSGKKNVILSQLSGGEKALTATALLFGIYLVKPSPFCILDEVDAPLDDANVERFMNLLKEFSETTQFILVTHNKLTMEAADRMYGITMEQQGVSKMVGVTFEQGQPDSEAA